MKHIISLLLTVSFLALASHALATNHDIDDVPAAASSNTTTHEPIAAASSK